MHYSKIVKRRAELEARKEAIDRSLEELQKEENLLQNLSVRQEVAVAQKNTFYMATNPISGNLIKIVDGSNKNRIFWNIIRAAKDEPKFEGRFSKAVVDILVEVLEKGAPSHRFENKNVPRALLYRALEIIDNRKRGEEATPQQWLHVEGVGERPTLKSHFGSLVEVHEIDMSTWLGDLFQHMARIRPMIIEIMKDMLKVLKHYKASLIYHAEMSKGVPARIEAGIDNNNLDSTLSVAFASNSEDTDPMPYVALEGDIEKIVDRLLQNILDQVTDLQPAPPLGSAMRWKRSVKMEIYGSVFEGAVQDQAPLEKDDVTMRELFALEYDLDDADLPPELIEDILRTQRDLDREAAEIAEARSRHNNTNR